MVSNNRKNFKWTVAGLCIAVIIACLFPQMSCMMSQEKTLTVPTLSTDTVTIKVDETQSISIRNVDEDKVVSMRAWSVDPMILEVTPRNRLAFDIKGVTAYEETEVTVELELKEKVAPKKRYWFALKAVVDPDRNLASDGRRGRAPDYSRSHDWLHLPEKTDKPVDTFFIYSTQYSNDAEGAPQLAPMDDPLHRIGARGLYRSQGTIFERETNVYAPFYRQTNMMEYFGTAGKEPMKYQRHEQKLDICSALDYYFEHYNNGRPFIIAGHSQGSMMTLIVLEDYMKRHPEYYSRMVAAYAIGFSVTKQDLENYPHLKFAEGATDTGVVISWNTEGAANRNQWNFVVPKGSIAINPINWKRDSTYAPASENLGSRVQDPKTGKYSIKKNWGDARVNTERGVVVTHTLFTPNQKTELYGTASYHSKDIALYYKNFIKNIHDRVKAYCKANGIRYRVKTG